MLHPILESLFFLKVARESVCSSIIESNIEEKDALVNYIKNEASDLEVMHLVTLGEMPETKFDAHTEAAVWYLFKEAVIMNTDLLSEDVSTDDIMNIVYEMGPVSDFGYSSAAPILEFDRANGRLDVGYLSESVTSYVSDFFSGQKTKKQNKDNVAASKSSMSDKNLDRKVGSSAKKGQVPAELRRASGGKDMSAHAVQARASKKRAAATTSSGGSKGTTYHSDPTVKQTASNLMKAHGGKVAAGAVGVAGLYGLYKLYKGWKAKKAAATTPEAKAAAAKGEAAALAKIKKAKAKK